MMSPMRDTCLLFCRYAAVAVEWRDGELHTPNTWYRTYVCLSVCS